MLYRVPHNHMKDMSLLNSVQVAPYSIFQMYFSLTKRGKQYILYLFCFHLADF